MLVDSHCHLNFPDFKDDLDGVVARAKQAGVGVMQTICTELAEFEEVHALTQRYEELFCSVGVHPNDSGKTAVAKVEALTERAVLPKVIGIGETGLDFHYETTDRKTQIKSFYNHLYAAVEAKLPVIVHSRDAEEETVRILHEVARTNPSLTGVIHCFTSSQYLADKAMEIGFYISFSGIVTFKNAKGIQETAKTTPLERILIETDAPYLAPIPHRGKRNEPSFVSNINCFIAGLKQTPKEEIARATTENFFRLFSRAKAPVAA